MKEYQKIYNISDLRLALSKNNSEHDSIVFELAINIYKMLVKNNVTDELSMIDIIGVINKLINEFPLSPITENDFDDNNRCIKLNSVIKKDNGEIIDNSRTVFIKQSDNSIYFKLEASNIVDKLFPIKLPYMPFIMPYKVYGEFDNINDKLELFYIITPDGEKIDLNNNKENNNNNGI